MSLWVRGLEVEGLVDGDEDGNGGLGMVYLGGFCIEDGVGGVVLDGY